MPRDRDENLTPTPKARLPFDPGTLPRWRSELFPTPDDPPGKPAPALKRETALEVDPNIVPWVEPTFRVTTDESRAKRARQEPAAAPAPQKRIGQDWRLRTLAKRATEPPPRAEKPASESQAALRAFLDAAEADAQIETPFAEDDQDPPA